MSDDPIPARPELVEGFDRADHQGRLRQEQWAARVGRAGTGPLIIKYEFNIFIP